VEIIGGIFSEDFCKKIQGSYARIREVFSNRFNLHQNESYGREHLGPKPVVEEALGDDFKRVRFANGIEEERRLGGEKWEIESRRYPNGDFEKGKFDGGKLRSGVRICKGEYEFIHPKKLSNSILSSDPREFAMVEIDGKKQLALLKKEGSSYCLCKDAPVPFLFEIAEKDQFSTLIKDAMEAPLSPIQPKEVVEYAFAMGENGLPRIFELKEGNVLAILKEAQKLEIPFDFHPLFAKWVIDGHAELVKCMLEMDPTCIDQTKNQPVSFVRQALNVGDRKEKIDLLKNAMKTRGLDLSESDLWVERIYQGDASFTDEEFKSLEPSFQKELYWTAHAQNHIDLVDRLNHLGMKQQPDLPQGPTPLSYNMDLVEQRKAVETYLLELRDKKRLLLPEEAPENLKSFHYNYNDFSRVPGADFVKKTVQRLGLKHVDAAETFAILKPGADTIFIKTDHGVYIQSDKMDIYAEKIVEKNRFVSLEEAYELLDLIEATGYADIHPGNFMVTPDKIYIVDLESTNFQKHAAYSQLGRIVGLVKPEDQDALCENINARIERCQKKIEDSEAENKGIGESLETFYSGHGFYKFPVGSIMN